jgi:hypothetical protein
MSRGAFEKTLGYLWQCKQEMVRCVAKLRNASNSSLQSGKEVTNVKLDLYRVISRRRTNQANKFMFSPAIAIMIFE